MTALYICLPISNEWYKLVNVSKISDESLKNRIWSGTLEYFLKHIRAPRLLEKWEEIIGILPDIAKESNGIDYIQLLLNYTLTAINEDDKIKLEKLLRRILNKQKLRLSWGV